MKFVQGHPWRALGATAVLALSASLTWAQGVLENPTDGSAESGIGIISGWHCDASIVTLQFDSQIPVEAAYGTERNDTSGACGDSDNGFGLLYNFNLLGDGPHTVTAFADGVQFAQAAFSVTTLSDQEFITGASSQSEVTSLSLGHDLMLQWQENKQNYVIVDAPALTVTEQQITAGLSGTWIGTWEGLGTGGAIAMTIEDDPNAIVRVAGFQLSGTGCGEDAVSSTSLTDIDDPRSDVTMSDGSELTLYFIAPDSLIGIAGYFTFNSGLCQGSSGVFTLQR